MVTDLQSMSIQQCYFIQLIACLVIFHDFMSFADFFKNLSVITIKPASALLQRLARILKFCI